MKQLVLIISSVIVMQGVLAQMPTSGEIVNQTNGKVTVEISFFRCAQKTVTLNPGERIFLEKGCCVSSMQATGVSGSVSGHSYDYAFKSSFWGMMGNVSATDCAYTTYIVGLSAEGNLIITSK